MSIRPSAAADITRLIGELVSGDAQRRELAGARLTVIGPRATTALLGVAGEATHSVQARIAALDALSGIGDRRAAALALALAAAPGDDDLAGAAIALLGQIARGSDPKAIAAFDRLASIITDARMPTARRLAGLAAMEGQPEALLRPLYEALAGDPAARVVARITRRQAGALEPLETLVARGLNVPAEVAAAVVRDDGERASLTTLKKAVDAAKAREREQPDPAARTPWAAVRGAAHHHLAARKSRLALYDLRETLEQAAGPLPVGFLSAAAAIGDPACLPPLAMAWVHSSDADRWWREHLADAFRAIVKREGLTRRHPTLKKILERWPSAGVLVAVAKK